MNKKITIKNAKDKIFEAELIMCFDIEELQKSYIIYKFSDEDEGDLVTLHTSILVSNENDSYVLEEIKDDNEWKIIKMIMKKVIEQSEEV